MNKFTTWYFKNYIKITWFVIGLLFAAGVESFGAGNYVWAVFYWAVAAVNYLFSRQ
jgi:hypothetical protein